ncbi:TetR/AcrR family transcriptional regulator [Magnetovibrio sp.]|uniref:TetR/AcrR family transcriptional regulator n=1 Tax=Magnetovibrio sp. TaxID=2024836 RepID=UPI002F9386F5
MSSPSARPMPSNDDILDIATAAFAEKGFEGARVDEIAKAAGVNKATLYYRIGDKDALYSAVLERIFAAKGTRMQHMLQTVEDPEERVRTFARILVDGEHPEQFSAIMMREVANGGRNLPDTVLPLMGRVVGALQQTLKDGVQQGRFNPVDPFLVHMMLMGACSLYATNTPIRRRVAAMAPQGVSLNTEISLIDAADTIADMLLSGMRKTPDPQERPDHG